MQWFLSCDLEVVELLLFSPRSVRKLIQRHSL